MKKEDLILIGGGGHACSCVDVIESTGKYNIAGIVDLPTKLHQKVMGYEVIATDDDLDELAQEYAYFHISIGQIKSPRNRMTIFNRLVSLTVKIPAIISPMAYISPHAKIGKGTIVMHRALVNAGANIGENCIINSQALIEHDCQIGNHCHISTGALLNGYAEVGEGSFIGSGTVCNEAIKIGRKSVIASNSRIAENLPNNSIFR